MKAYYEIPMESADVPKTAIITPFGLVEYVRMPFGLRNAAQACQRFMDEVIRGLPFCYALTDDEHKNHFHVLFHRLEGFGVVVNVAKSVFGVPALDFLGHRVDCMDIRPLDTKVQALWEFPMPQTTRELREFLGLINIYRRFLPNCAALLQPVRDLLAATRTTNTPLAWTENFRRGM